MSHRHVLRSIWWKKIPQLKFPVRRCNKLMTMMNHHGNHQWLPCPQVKPKVFNLESRAFRNIALPPHPSLSLTSPYLCISPAHSRRETPQQHSGICSMHTILLWPLLFHFYFIWLAQLDKEFGVLYYIQNIIFLIVTYFITKWFSYYCVSDIQHIISY